MKITPKNQVRKFQAGGNIDTDTDNAENAQPVEETAAPEDYSNEGGEEQAGQEQDPLTILLQMAVQAVQNQDCNMAMQECRTFIQLVQQASGQQQAAQQEQGEPVFAKGGRLIRRIRK